MDNDNRSDFDLAQRLFYQAKSLVIESEDLSPAVVETAISKLKEAEQLYPCEKYRRRICSLQTFLDELNQVESNDTSSSDLSKSNADAIEDDASNHVSLETNSKTDLEKVSDGYVKISEGLRVKEETYNKLFSYQKYGVKWLYKMFVSRHGCILADDMGLGKTVQAIVLIASLLKSNHIKTSLIIAPKTLITNWGKEFRKWAPEVCVMVFDSSASIQNRLRALRNVQLYTGVLLCTYDLCRNNQENFSFVNGRSFIWDIHILDEGHKLKNATKTTRSMYEIPSRIRIVITGTPVQNNLRELWALYDFASKGTLLGSYTTFKIKYEQPITNARSKDARPRQILLGAKIAASLRQIYEPYFLRRTKKEVANELCQSSRSPFSLPSKTDWVTWVYLSEQQISIYKDFLSLESVKELLLQANKKLALVKLIIMKKICDHPRLISRNICEQLMYNDKTLTEEEMENLNSNDMVSIDNVSDEQLISESGKLRFCLDLLENLRENGNSTLLFSQSLKILDMFQRILTTRGWNLVRLDGRVNKMSHREAIVESFQTDDSISLCLLTTQVGGVGLTLTKADRVIIYDPSWNPAVDAQAVDRAYRIGQKRDVIVYRLITCGSIEEKIYQRQIFKDSIMKQTIGGERDPMRYFTDTDLHTLFEFEDPKVSKTCDQILEIHGNNFSSSFLSKHKDDLKQLASFHAITSHHMLYSIEDESVILEPTEAQMIDIEVEAARIKLLDEGAASNKILQESGAHCRPLELTVAQRAPKIIAKEITSSLPHPIDLVDLTNIQSHSHKKEDKLLFANNSMQFIPEELLEVSQKNESTNQRSAAETSSAANNSYDSNKSEPKKSSRTSIVDYFKRIGDKGSSFKSSTPVTKARQKVKSSSIDQDSVEIINLSDDSNDTPSSNRVYSLNNKKLEKSEKTYSNSKYSFIISPVKPAQSTHLEQDLNSETSENYHGSSETEIGSEDSSTHHPIYLDINRGKSSDSMNNRSSTSTAAVIGHQTGKTNHLLQESLQKVSSDDDVKKHQTKKKSGSKSESAELRDKGDDPDYSFLQRSYALRNFFDAMNELSEDENVEDDGYERSFLQNSRVVSNFFDVINESSEDSSENENDDEDDDDEDKVEDFDDANGHEAVNNFVGEDRNESSQENDFDKDASDVVENSLTSVVDETRVVDQSLNVTNNNSIIIEDFVDDLMNTVSKASRCYKGSDSCKTNVDRKVSGISSIDANRNCTVKKIVDKMVDKGSDASACSDDDEEEEEESFHRSKDSNESSNSEEEISQNDNLSDSPAIFKLVTSNVEVSNGDNSCDIMQSVLDEEAVSSNFNASGCSDKADSIVSNRESQELLDDYSIYNSSYLGDNDNFENSFSDVTEHLTDTNMSKKRTSDNSVTDSLSSDKVLKVSDGSRYALKNEKGTADASMSLFDQDNAGKKDSLSDQNMSDCSADPSKKNHWTDYDEQVENASAELPLALLENLSHLTSTITKRRPTSRVTALEDSFMELL